jgi:hypothetical protein
VTGHAGPPPVPARITDALNAIGADGPEVDVALGGVEPMVDEWEAGTRLPQRWQIERLAKMTGRPVGYFYAQPEKWEQAPVRLFICQRNRRPENALTVVESWIDRAGVRQTRTLVEPRSPYRYRPRRQTAPKHARVAVEHRPDPETPGCCTCGLPLDVANARHARRPGRSSR